MDTKQVVLDSPLPKRAKRDHASSSTPVVLNRFRKKKKYCDITLVVDNDEYPAHKLVLIAFSRFFKKMLTGKFEEANQTAVTLSNVESCVMEPILNYAYTEEIELKESNVYDILKAADYLEATPLFEECCKFLERNLKAKDVLGIWNLANVYRCMSLRENAEKFILTHFAEVTAEIEFLELEADKLISIISNDNLNVDKEEVVFDAVVKWLHYKQEDREKVLDKVLSEVRLAHIDPLLLHDRVQATKAIAESASCMRLVEFANKYNLLPSRRMELQVSVTRRRVSSSHVEAMEIYMKVPETGERRIVLLTEDGRVGSPKVPPVLKSKVACYIRSSNYENLVFHLETKQVWIWDTKEERWKTIAPLDCDVTTAFVKVDKYWYAIGGEVGKSYAKSVFRYNPSEDLWTSVAPFLEAATRARLACVTVSGQLYVAGGYCGEDVKVQRFDPRSSCSIWVEETTLPREVAKTKQYACALNNRIYVCAQETTKVFFYDCSCSRWGSCADLNNPLWGRLVTMNGRLFAITARPDGQRVMERYIPFGSGGWQEFAIFPGLELTGMMGPTLYSRDKFNGKGDDHVKLMV